MLVLEVIVPSIYIYINICIVWWVTKLILGITLSFHELCYQVKRWISLTRWHFMKTWNYCCSCWFLLDIKSKCEHSTSNHVTICILRVIILSVFVVSMLMLAFSAGVDRVLRVQQAMDSFHFDLPVQLCENSHIVSKHCHEDCESDGNRGEFSRHSQ